MSRRELQVLRRRLEQRSKDVTQLHSVSKLLAQERSTDHLDDAQAEADFGLAVCIINEDWKVQNAVRSALDRIRSGKYGACEWSNEPIQSKRLSAVPWAARCARCQTLYEGAEDETGVYRSAA